MSDTIQNAPIVYPTMEEFINPEQYLQHLENKYSNDFGMVKIIPPQQWKARTLDYDTSIEKNMIPNPIEQNLYGKGGVYECLHIIKKSMQVKEYIKRSKKFDSITEGKTAAQVEILFWKNIAFSPPLYGSDFQDSLFDKGVPWNLTEIKSLLNDGVDSVMSGVTAPYLYMGHWKTMFCWHKEDLDLGALNYLHYGKTKYWYSIPAHQGEILEKTAKQYFPENFAKCSEHLRHKTVVINPHILQKKHPDLKLCKIEHNANEIIAVFPGAYHHGFNFGFNIAESVNYATLNWLPHFIDSKPCKCQRGHVKINHMEFYQNLLQNRPHLTENIIVQEFYEELVKRGLDQEYLRKKQEEEEENKLSDETQGQKDDQNLNNISNSTNSTKQAHDNSIDEIQMQKSQNLVGKNKVLNKKIKKYSSSISNSSQKEKQQNCRQKNNSVASISNFSQQKLSCKKQKKEDQKQIKKQKITQSQQSLENQMVSNVFPNDVDLQHKLQPLQIKNLDQMDSFEQMIQTSEQDLSIFDNFNQQNDQPEIQEYQNLNENSSNLQLFEQIQKQQQLQDQNQNDSVKEDNIQINSPMIIENNQIPYNSVENINNLTINQNNNINNQNNNNNSNQQQQMTSFQNQNNNQDIQAYQQNFQFQNQQQQQQLQQCHFKKCDETTQNIQLVQKIKEQVPQIRDDQQDLIIQIQERINREKQQIKNYYPRQLKSCSNSTEIDINKVSNQLNTQNLYHLNIQNNQVVKNDSIEIENQKKQPFNENQKHKNKQKQENTQIQIDKNQQQEQEILEQKQKTLLQQQLQQKIDQFKKQQQLQQNLRKTSTNSTNNIYKEDQKKQSISKKSSMQQDIEESDSSGEYDVQEDWFQCDSCQKWRKIMDKKFGRKLKRRKYFYCSYLENMNCDTLEENYGKDYKILKQNY